jgi:rhamnose utilization protein RhaD (predicted bifunctional aldolase and dehydrogenase)
LLRCSARIGRNLLLAQASSGNTSIKLDGTLWIKASGKWLANAEQEELLVPVSLSECLECFRHGRPLTASIVSSRGEHLLPSIETFMHAVLPHRTVIHVHCVDTLVWAVRADAPARLSERLSGMRWMWIPYVPSGLPLAREIQLAITKRPDADVFILGNHGLVVCGESCEEAEATLSEVRRCLANNTRSTPKPKTELLERIQSVCCWRLPDSNKLHALATDPISRQILRRGVLYPCQAIFLGLSSFWISEEQLRLEKRLDALDRSCPFFLVEGCGTLINNRITASELAVLEGLAEVVLRIHPAAPIRYLSDLELTNLLESDSHLYRASAENGSRSCTSEAARI